MDSIQTKSALPSASVQPSKPGTNRILGYTRWNDDIIVVESADDASSTPAPSSSASSEIVSTIIATPTLEKPSKIKISLSHNQINGKPPPSKPSSIPRRPTNHMRPSSVLNQSMSLQTNASPRKPSPVPPPDSDPYNDVFITTTTPSSRSPGKVKQSIGPTTAGRPSISTTNTATDCRIPATEKVSLLRKFSAPTIESSLTVNLLQTMNTNRVSGSSKTGGARIAATSSFKLNSATVRTDHKFIEDRYKCTLCANPFSDPRVLDCLHTFCFACLCNITAGGLGVVAGGGGGDTDGAMLLDVDDATEVGSVAGGRHGRLHGDGSELDLSVSGTGKSSESILPKSHSNSSSIGTVVEQVRDKCSAGPSVASVRNLDVKSKAKKKSISKPPRSRTSSAASYSDCPKSIVCPTCSVQTTVPVGGMHRLPSNFVVKRKVKDALLKLGRDLHTAVWCTLCFNETLAVACCLICNMNLCTFCKEAHVRQRSTSLHDVRYLNDLRANYQQQCGDVNAISRTAAAAKGIKCSIHPSHELKLFCTVCHQVACSNCTILLHRGHKCEPIVKASKVFVKMVKTGLDRTRPLTDYANDAILQLNSYTKTVVRRAEVVQTEVDHFLTQYLDALDAHRRTLHTQIIRARESKMKNVAEHQSHLAKRCADARTAIQFAEDLLATGNDTEILTFAGVLLRRFEHCQRSRDFLDPRSSDALTFLPEIRAPFTIDQNNIPMYGIITTQTAEPKFCSFDCEGLMQLRVHRKVELTMTSRDGEDRPLCHGGLTVDVVLKYRDVSARAIATKVADRRDGTYVVSFVPDAAGSMVMTVMVQGKHVKGSPFSMHARTLRPHSGIFHCCTFCSSKGSKSALCACKSVMVGGYKGCGHGHDGHPGRRHWSCCGSDLETSECSATNAFR